MIDVWYLGFSFLTESKAKSKPKLACVDAWGSDSKVHSIAMPMSASTSRKSCGKSAEATEGTTSLPSAFVLAKKTKKKEKKEKTAQSMYIYHVTTMEAYFTCDNWIFTNIVRPMRKGRFVIFLIVFLPRFSMDSPSFV